MSSHEAPEIRPPAALRQPGTLSKVAGAGFGTAVVAWASVLGLGPTITHALELSGPAAAVAISAFGPYVIGTLKYHASWYGLHMMLKRAKKRVRDTQAGSASHAEAQESVEWLESTINQLLKDGAASIVGLWISKTDPKNRHE